MNNSVVENFLNQRRVSGDAKHTHVAMGEKFVGKFYLNETDNKEFLKLYAKAVANECIFNIAEKPKKYGPLLIDIDLELELKDKQNERLYNNDMIFEIIDAYRDAAKKYLDLDCDELSASVFEKPKPSIKNNTIVKDGVHIIFQGITAHYKLRFLIRNLVVKKLSNSNTFKNFKNSVDTIFDKAIINTNCWLLQGSKKKDGQLYELKYILDENNKPMDINKITKDKYKMIRLYSLQDKIRCEENSNNYKDDITFEIIEEDYKKINDRPSINNESIQSKNNNKDDMTTTIENCLKCLPIDDYNDYENWSIIALAINNELGYNGLETLINWSSDGEGFDKSKVEQFYKNIKPKENGVKIGTLKKMAKESNPELYKQLFKKNNAKQNNEEYEKNKIKFELTNFKLLDPVSFATIREDKSLILRNKKDFVTVYENLLIDNDDKKVSFVSEWLKDPNNRTYEKIDFLPMQEAPPNIYNTFKGFQAEKTPLIKTDIENSLIYNHIKNLCNNNEVVFNYFIKFLANLVKAPYNISKTAIILKSIQGCGKDTLFDWFGNHILGSDYYINTDKAELIFGRFNSCIENKILVVMNETNGKDTFSINENIKCAITAKENTIEHKGKAPYKNTNNIAYVFLTNNDNPIKVPHDDRRFCGIECNNNIANNFDYFKNLNDEINNKSYDRAFYNYLLTIDVNNYDFTNNRPITSFYNNMKELNTPIIAKFFEDMINKYYNDKTVNFTASTLYDNFNSFIKNNNFKIEYTSTKFGIDIKNYEGIEKKRTKMGNHIFIDINQLKQYLTKKYNIEFSDEEFIDDIEDKSSLDI